MIWAAGISRIIDYVLRKGVSDYNQVANEMEKLKKSGKEPYKRLSYRNNYSDENDLRDGKDWQMLYFLLYKNFISTTELNKLKTAYNTRCDCAHPTDVDVSLDEAIAIFSNVHKLFFANKKLK